jgi:tRNA pseudouridine55 synthase
VSRRRTGRPISGWIALDKPFGMGSTEAVARVRRLFDANKAGHAGTLDPLASGALPIALGEATKTVSHLMDAQKVYRFTIEWGASTATDDKEGAVLARSDHRPTAGDVHAALAQFTGVIEQTPPIYSAIKVEGERAYDLARSGCAVTLQPRSVTVLDLQLIDVPDPDHVTLQARCGKGVYVRSLARDLAATLKACGHVSALRRLSVGRFSEPGLISLETLASLVQEAHGSRALLPVETALDDIPALAVTHEDALSLRQGRSIDLLPQQVETLQTRFVASPRSQAAAPCIVSATLRDGVVVALCDLRAGRLIPTRVFNVTET